MTRDKRRELLERLRKAGARPQFFAIGAVCPKCGYVFSNGFSQTDGSPEPTHDTATPCTRCMSWLVLQVRTKTLRLATAEELADIRADLAKGPNLTLDLVKHYRESKS